MSTEPNTPLVLNLFWKQKLGGDNQKYKEGLIKAKSTQRAVQGNLKRLPEHAQTRCELVSEKPYVQFADDTEILGDGKYQLFAKGGKENSEECSTQTIDDLWNNFSQEKEKFIPEEREEFTKLFVSMRDALNIGEQWDLYKILKMFVDVKQNKDSVVCDLDRVEKNIKKDDNILGDIVKQIKTVKTFAYNTHDLKKDDYNIKNIIVNSLMSCIAFMICMSEYDVKLENDVMVAKTNSEAHKKMLFLMKHLNEVYLEQYQKKQRVDCLKKDDHSSAIAIEHRKEKKSYNWKQDNRFLFLIASHEEGIKKLVNSEQENDKKSAFVIQQIYNSACKKINAFINLNIFYPSIGFKINKQRSVADNLNKINPKLGFNPSAGMGKFSLFKEMSPLEEISAQKMFDTHQIEEISAQKTPDTQSKSNSKILTWQPKLIDIVEPVKTDAGEPIKIDDAIIKKALQEIKNVIAQERKFNMTYEA